MAVTGEELSAEQESVLSEVEQMVLAAVSEQCTCSTAKFQPGKIARAVALERVPVNVAEETAERFANCPGLSEVVYLSIGEKAIRLCHYPQPEK